MDWGNDKGAAQNLIDYMSDMDVLVSQLQAARMVVAGIYNHNPISREVPSFDGLYDDLQAMCLDLRAAKKNSQIKT
jgi:hypothetical protein